MTRDNSHSWLYFILFLIIFFEAGILVILLMDHILVLQISQPPSENMIRLCREVPDICRRA